MVSRTLNAYSEVPHGHLSRVSCRIQVQTFLRRGNMNEEKQQKFTAKVRRGLVWIHTVAAAELAKKKAEATGVRIEGFTASELADVESALTWIAQNKESPSAEAAS